MNLLAISNFASWSVQVGIIVAAALVTLKLVRLDVPAVRYLFLRLVLAACLLLPFVQPRAAPNAESNPVTSPSTIRPNASDVHLAAPVRPVSERARPVFNAGGAVAGLVITGAVVRLVWIGLGVIRLRGLRRMGEIATPSREHEELQFIIRTSAVIRYVVGLGQPVTFGVRRPVVLLPESLKEQPDAIQRAVLAHELWHVRRRDWIWTVMEEAVRAVFWFHPGVWMLVSSIQATREEVVDELTILATGSRRSYVNALLAYADRPPLLAATAFARRRHLMRRMILISKEAVMSARRVVVCGAVVVTVVLSAGWYSIDAFPLTQSVDAPNQASPGPGPVERRAKPITPENPIPRRTYYVPPDYPLEAEAIGARGVVTVRVTLDEVGHLAEARIVGLSMRFADKRSVSMSGMNSANFEAAMEPHVRLSGDRAVFQSITEAALRAVKQWQYAAPADGPIAFPVSVPVGPQTTEAIPPPPPPAPGTAAWEIADGALRVGGEIKAPAKIRHVAPTYPADAQSARVQGVVILEARIEPDGRVSQARVLRSIPMLDEAALEAVRQWEFTPTLLNNQPVPVVMTVTVNFVME